VDSAISFPNTYPLDSAIQRLNNRGQEWPQSQLSFWDSREKSRENRTRSAREGWAARSLGLLRIELARRLRQEQYAD